MLLVVLSMVYIILKLNKSDRKMRKEGRKDLDLSYLSESNSRLDYKTEGMLIRDKKIIKRYKLAWVYAPDKLQNYLEDMELKGYNLYRVNKLGITFYFVKGESKKTAYCIDHQNSVSDSYYEINKQDGWVIKFTSLNMFKKYVILAKEYIEEKPELYSDKGNILKQARNNCILYSSMTILYLVMYIKLIISMNRLYEGYFNIPIFIYIFIILILEWLYFSYLAMGYYRRIKKSSNL